MVELKKWKPQSWAANLIVIFSPPCWTEKSSHWFPSNPSSSIMVSRQMEMFLPEWDAGKGATNGVYI